MRIEEYFRQIQKIIDSYSVIQSSKIMFDKRGTYEGFIRGDIFFLDGSILHLREFVDIELTKQAMQPLHCIDGFDSAGVWMLK